MDLSYTTTDALRQLQLYARHEQSDSLTAYMHIKRIVNDVIADIREPDRTYHGNGRIWVAFVRDRALWFRLTYSDDNINGVIGRLVEIANDLEGWVDWYERTQR